LGTASQDMVNRTGPEPCTGVGPGVQFKGRAGCSSSVMCEVCRFRTLRPIYLAICRMRKSCRGRSHALQSPRFRRGFSDLPGRPIDCRDAKNDSTPILATAKNMTIVKFLNFPKTPIFLTDTTPPSLYPRDVVVLDECTGGDIPLAREDSQREIKSQRTVGRGRPSYFLRRMPSEMRTFPN
jgi:hypothetical protein